MPGLDQSMNYPSLLYTKQNTLQFETSTVIYINKSQKEKY
jgi:hypothetical protein